jgi:hypothetical protein
VQGDRLVMRLYTGDRLVMRLYTGDRLVMRLYTGGQVSNETIYRGTGTESMCRGTGK